MGDIGEKLRPWGWLLGSLMTGLCCLIAFYATANHRLGGVEELTAEQEVRIRELENEVSFRRGSLDARLASIETQLKDLKNLLNN